MDAIQIRLLLVEDNPDDAELVQATLEDLTGVTVRTVTADRLAHALERLSEQTFDVMLLDLSLPDSHGVETIEKIRMRSPNLPIVILTGLNDDAVAYEAARSGAQDYLVKGRFDADTLGRSLRYAIERGRVETELRSHRDHLEEIVERRTSDLRRNSESLQQEMEQRKAAEANHRLLATAVEHAGEGLMITNAQGIIQYVNPALERMTGYTRDEFIGKDPRILNSGQHSSGYVQGIYSVISNGHDWHGQFINRKKDGTLFTTEASISNVSDQSGNIQRYIAIYHDVTEEVRLRERLNRAQRLETVGQLAGGIAHDFNNILQAILGYAGLNGTELPEDSELAHNNREIILAASRATELTKQLLAFGRKQLLQREPIDINNVILPLLNMLRRLMREDIELDLVPGHHLGTVEADIGQVEQILVNLCVNARDAMPVGGRITIETENVLLNGNYTRAHPWARPGRFVLLSVSDTGMGMPPEVVDRIFEPFFTTKPDGVGTGLGLATVYGIVKQHDGFIHCYSEVEKGTSFKIYLPVSSRRAEAVGPKIEGKACGGSETILIVEDDLVIRTLVSRILEKAGYTFLLASNGDDALEKIDGGAQVDLILSDIVMPKMGGIELYNQLRARAIATPVLLASGYSSRAIDPGIFNAPGVSLVQKPYAPDDLLRKIRSMFDGT